MDADISMLLNVNKVVNKLDNFDDKVVSSFLNDATLMVETSAKRLCPNDTGELRGSITSYVKGNTGVVGTNCSYAIYVHQGTGIYAANGDGRTWDLP